MVLKSFNLVLQYNSIEKVWKIVFENVWQPCCHDFL